MTRLLQNARRTLDPVCLVKHGVRKDGCDVKLTDAPAPRLIVDFDKPRAPSTSDGGRCDFFMIAEGTDERCWVVPLELKRGKLHATQAVRQLRQGARVAERFISDGKLVRFCPVAVSGSVPRHERAILRKPESRIRFHGRKEPIRRLSCGAPLKQVLDS